MAAWTSLALRLEARRAAGFISNSYFTSPKSGFSIAVRHLVRFSGLVLMIPLALAAAGPPKIESPSVIYDSAAINDPALMEIVGPQSRGSAVVRAQILLDRAHFSSGEIDGSYGRNLRKAIVAYQTAHGLHPNG